METGNVSFRLPSLVRCVLESSRSSKNLRFIATPRFPGGGALVEYINKYYNKTASAFSLRPLPTPGLTARCVPACGSRVLAIKVLRITSLHVARAVEPFVQENAVECKRCRARPATAR